MTSSPYCKSRPSESTAPTSSGTFKSRCDIFPHPRRSAVSERRPRRLEESPKTFYEKLWNIEDEILNCEAAKDFAPRFIELARSVYQTNDMRARVKKQIDELFGSAITEEKSYADY